jgi:hypothetical protein
LLSVVTVLAAETYRGKRNKMRDKEGSKERILKKNSIQ